MSSQSGRRDPAKRPLEEAMRARAQRRRDRVRADLRRHREGDYRIPTWVLATVAAVILAAFIYVIITT